MHILAILELAAQIFFSVHAVKTGRPLYWVFLIVVFPVIGCIVYFIAEYFPDHRQQSRIRRSRGGAGPISKRRLRELEDNLELNPSMKNKKDLAEGYMNTGRFDKAISLYESCLGGMHENDPAIIEGLCCAHFFKGDFGKAKELLLRLMALRGNREWDEFDLLLARAYEELGETDKALEEYAALERTFAGEEARCRYALLLKKTGNRDEARRIFNEIVKNVRLSPKFHQRAQKKWVGIAKKNR